MDLQTIMNAHVFCEKENDGFVQLFNANLDDALSGRLCGHSNIAMSLAEARQQTIAFWPQILEEKMRKPEVTLSQDDVDFLIEEGIFDA